MLDYFAAMCDNYPHKNEGNDRHVYHDHSSIRLQAQASEDRPRQVIDRFVGVHPQTMRHPKRRKRVSCIRWPPAFAWGDIDGCPDVAHGHPSNRIRLWIPYDTVRCPFVEGEPVFPDSHFFDHSHIQVSVRNPMAIVSLFPVEMPFPAHPII